MQNNQLSSYHFVSKSLICTSRNFVTKSPFLSFSKLGYKFLCLFGNQDVDVNIIVALLKSFLEEVLLIKYYAGYYHCHGHCF